MKRLSANSDHPAPIQNNRILDSDHRNANPVISIITVVRNGVSEIAATMDSVICQDGVCVEYIVIDGGSNDGTVALIREREAHLSYWVSEADSGIYDAMNKGIRLASGGLVGILNSGDRLRSDALRIVSQSFCDSNADIVTGQLLRFSRSGGLRFTNKRSPVDLLRPFDRMPINHPATFVASRLYSEIGIFDTSFSIMADYDFTLRAIYAGAKIFYVDDVLVDMELGGVSERAASLLARTGELYRLQRRHGRSCLRSTTSSAWYLSVRGMKSLLELLGGETVRRAYHWSKDRNP